VLGKMKMKKLRIHPKIFFGTEKYLIWTPGGGFKKKEK